MNEEAFFATILILFLKYKLLTAPYNISRHNKNCQTNKLQYVTLSLTCFQHKTF